MCVGLVDLGALFSWCPPSTGVLPSLCLLFCRAPCGEGFDGFLFGLTVPVSLTLYLMSGYVFLYFFSSAAGGSFFYSALPVPVTETSWLVYPAHYPQRSSSWLGCFSLSFSNSYILVSLTFDCCSWFPIWPLGGCPPSSTAMTGFSLLAVVTPDSS